MRAIVVVATILVLSVTVRAQDQSNPDELNRKYQDALTQLKAAQDRKNELATENEKLNARLAELEKQLEEAKRQAATFSEQTFRLRSHYAAWQAFLRRYPSLHERWRVFLENSPLAFPWELPVYADPGNPLSLE